MALGVPDSKVLSEKVEMKKNIKIYWAILLVISLQRDKQKRYPRKISRRYTTVVVLVSLGSAQISGFS